MTFRSEQEYASSHHCAVWSDRAELGKIIVRGADRFSWLQGMISNDTRLLTQGQNRLQSYVLNATGHILAEITLFNFSEALLLTTERSCVASLFETLDRYLIMEDVELEEVSETWDALAVHGHKAQDFAPLFGAETLFAASTLGLGGFEWVGDRATGARLRERLREADVMELSAETSEILRVEAGIPRYPAELNERIIALEAGNAATHISLTKGCYVGQEIVARIDSRGHTNRSLTRLLVSEGETPLSGDKIFSLLEDGVTKREVGWITSTIPCSPARDGKPLALGYVRHEFRESGTALETEEAVLQVLPLTGRE